MAKPDDAPTRGHLDLRELEKFAVVARTRHFGAAASALRITQSAVGQRISRLERSLRLPLLARSNQEHAAIIDRLAERDAAGTRALMERHVLLARDRVLAAAAGPP